MKMYYGKQKLSINHYRKFKDLDNDAFIKDLSRRGSYQNHFMKKQFLFRH